MEEKKEIGTALPEADRERKLSRAVRLARRNNKIIEAYNSLYKAGYRHDAICRELEPCYGLAPLTIARIVFKGLEKIDSKD